MRHGKARRTGSEPDPVPESGVILRPTSQIVLSAKGCATMNNARRFIAWAVLPFVLAACAGQQKVASFHVSIHGAAPLCAVKIKDRTVDMNELPTIARLEAKPGRHATISSELIETPYRCLGGAIYILQSAGFASVRFVGTPRSQPR